MRIFSKQDYKKILNYRMNEKFKKSSEANLQDPIKLKIILNNDYKTTKKLLKKVDKNAKK